METQEYQTLVQTLMSNHLAASASEAQRMAKEMLGISQRVQDDSKKEQHYMISGFKPDTQHVSQASGRPDVDMATGLPRQSSSQIAVEPQYQQAPLQPETKTSMPGPAQSQGPAFSGSNHMQDKINELRERAINPEPVNVQVEFQTPNMDAQTQYQKPIQQNQYNNSFSPQNSDLRTGQSEFANRNTEQISPEEYSANKFGNESISSLQSDFLSLKTPPKSEETITTNNLSADWPVQQPPVNNQQAQYTQSNSLPSSAPNEMIQNFQEEAVEEKTQEIVSEKRESKWTPEEERLKDQVDLSRVFNFSNK